MRSIQIIAIVLTLMITGTAFSQTSKGEVVNPNNKELKGPRAKNQKPGKRSSTIFLPIQTGNQEKLIGGEAKNTPIQNRDLVDSQNVITNKENLKGPKAKNRKHSKYQTPIFQSQPVTQDMAIRE